MDDWGHDSTLHWFARLLLVAVILWAWSSWPQ